MRKFLLLALLIFAPNISHAATDVELGNKYFKDDGGEELACVRIK